MKPLYWVLLGGGCLAVIHGGAVVLILIGAFATTIGLINANYDRVLAHINKKAGHS